MEEYMLPCLTKTYLGFDCMGCGLQRAALFLLKGEFSQAFYMYPAIYPLVLFFAFIGVSYLVKIPHSSQITTVLSITCVISILSAYIVKLSTIF